MHLSKISNNVVLDNTNNTFRVNLPVSKQYLLDKLNVYYIAHPHIKDTVVGFFDATLDSCRLIYNLGEYTILRALPVYYQDWFMVEGQYKPMEHQKLTAAYMVINPRCFVLSDCRLGKTGSAIMAMEWLKNNKIITGGALIITTLTTVTGVWLDNLITSCPDKKITVLHGKKDMGLLNTNNPSDYYITNYDTVRICADNFLRAVKSKKISYILVDELTHCGNISTLRTQAIKRLINEGAVAYAAGMTGTPGYDPKPVYGMVKTINPNNPLFPYRTLQGWMNETTIPGYFHSQYTIKSNANEYIFKAMQPAIRFRKEEVLNLPPITEQIRKVDLSKEQINAIEDLWVDALTELEHKNVMASNAAVKLNKILQVAQGFALTKEGEVVYSVPYPQMNDERSKAILDIINETDRKVVIFSMFRQRLKMIEQLLNNNKITNAVIHGQITGTERGDILRSFAKDPNPRCLIAHPITVGYGTELSQADTMIIDGPLLLGGFSYTQTLERLSSIKQTASNINIIKLIGDYRELKIFKRMDTNQSTSQIIGGLFEDARKEMYG